MPKFLYEKPPRTILMRKVPGNKCPLSLRNETTASLLECHEVIPSGQGFILAGIVDLGSPPCKRKKNC